jgi:hypothetical protein
LTRQLAVTHDVRSLFSFGNVTLPVETGYYVVSTNDAGGIIGETNYLPKGFIFDTALPGSVQFLADGSCAASSDINIVVREIRSANYLAATIAVFRATGFAGTLE